MINVFYGPSQMFNLRNRESSKNLRQVSKEYEKIYDLVYDWGIEYNRLLNLNTEVEEIKHFGKKIKEFTDEEWRGYEDGCEDIERYFEVLVPGRFELGVDCGTIL